MLSRWERQQTAGQKESSRRIKWKPSIHSMYQRKEDRSFIRAKSRKIPQLIQLFESESKPRQADANNWELDKESKEFKLSCIDEANI